MTTPITLSLRAAPAFAIDLSPLCAVAEKNTDPTRIADLRLGYGNRNVRLGDLFDVSGTDSTHIHIRNSCAALHGIGAGMTSGRIDVDGDAGDYLGLGQRGGHITVHGNVGNFAACGLRNGRIDIHGNCGDYAGAPRTGEMQGMRGGILCIHGNVGDRVGDRLRRGLIVVSGNAGAYGGTRMIAGTILIMGRTGPYVGHAMRRGTLILAQPPDPLPAAWVDCGTHELVFLRLFWPALRDIDADIARTLEFTSRSRRYCGDLSGIGRAEILVPSRH